MKIELSQIVEQIRIMLLDEFEAKVETINNKILIKFENGQTFELEIKGQ